jgi:ATP-dependent RNA helicase RhlB
LNRRNKTVVSKQLSMSEAMNFNEQNLSENLKKAIDDLGYVECTPVQEETYKLVMEERDVLAQSQTGTGKTAAFLIPTLQLFIENEKYKGGKALIVVPTRELAVQVEKEAKRLNAYLNFNILAVYGGVGYQQQETQLKEGVDIIIATPGRLIDFKKSGKIDMKEINICIIDEADRLFDMGFLPDLTIIMKSMRPPAERLTMLFSATLGTRVGNLAWEFMNNPGEVIIEPENITIDLVKQELYHVGRNEKMSLLLGLIKKYNPQTSLIFTNTKGMAYEVSQRLNENGYKSSYIIGDLPQNKRSAIMDSMKRGEIPFLVATDVAARGLHINDLEMVFNYDLPDEAESYVHRIGRTGRAGKEGHAISLACESFVLGLPAIESYIEMKIPVIWAEDEAFVEDASAGKRYRLDDSRGGQRGAQRGGQRGGRDNRGDRDNRGNRDSKRDNRGGRDNKRNNRDGRDSKRDNRGGRDVPFKRDDSRAASVVDQAVGSMDSFGKDNKKSAASSQPRGNRNNFQKGKGRRPQSKQNRNRSFDGDSSISGSLSVEDRLAYYRKKYGDDFKPTQEMLKGDKSRTSSKKSKKPKNNSSRGNPQKNKTASSQPVKKQQKPEQKPEKKQEKKPEKVPFLKKLFGKK